VNFAGLNNGPVRIGSTNGVLLLGAERVIYKVNGTNTSFSEMMGLPASQLDTTYWFPWYNNVDLDTQLRFANVSDQPASVQVFIGGTEMDGSPFTLQPGESTRKSFAAVNDGPVQIVSDQDLVAAERVIYKVNGTNTSFTEMMGLPASQLDTTYWLPGNTSADRETQLRFANVSSVAATVRVYRGWYEIPGSPFTLGAAQSTRVSLPTDGHGVIRLVSDTPIVASERVIYKVNGVNTSYSEMMALPNKQLDTTYWLPWYNNKDLETWVHFANTTDMSTNVRILIGGVEVTNSSFPLNPMSSTLERFENINNGPVQIVSDVPLVVAEQVIYKVNGLDMSLSEMMALPNGQLDSLYWLPWYNNVDLDTQLRLGVP
jgi:hypothetical protein